MGVIRGGAGGLLELAAGGLVGVGVLVVLGLVVVKWWYAGPGVGVLGQ